MLVRNGTYKPPEINNNNNQIKPLKFGTFNARSIKNKTLHINELIKDLEIDVFALTETWLRNEENNAVLINEMLPPGMKYFGKNRTYSRGGGVGICLREDIFNKVEIENDEQRQSFEHLSVNLSLNRLKLKTIVMYRNLDHINFIDEFDSFLNEKYEDCQNLIIMGDFNLHLTTNAKIVLDFKRLLTELNLNIVNKLDSATHNKGNVLDLTIGSEHLCTQLSNSHVHNDYNISDHFPLSFDLNYDHSYCTRKLIEYKDYASINYEEAATHLQILLYDNDLFNMSPDELSKNYNEIFEIYEQQHP